MTKCKLNGSGIPSQKPKMPNDLKNFLSKQKTINEVFKIDKDSLNIILKETEKYILLKSECNRLLKKCDFFLHKMIFVSILLFTFAVSKKGKAEHPKNSRHKKNKILVL